MVAFDASKLVPEDLRSEVTRCRPYAAETQDPSISAEAVKRCKAFVADPNTAASLNADIRLAVFDVAVKSEGDAMFDELIKAHDTQPRTHSMDWFCWEKIQEHP